MMRAVGKLYPAKGQEHAPPDESNVGGECSRTHQKAFALERCRTVRPVTASGQGARNSRGELSNNEISSNEIATFGRRTGALIDV
uniref:Uncharacterized protein n=1 Tax=Anopheles albimanus TaxID=7167 RepID=A0A182F0N8_ANOAL